jgi:hypothetical protein
MFVYLRCLAPAISGINMKVEPWPATYEDLGSRIPTKLVSKYEREVGAFRSAIPGETIEPPQVHLIAPRDGNPFEELITGFNLPFRVDFWDFAKKKLRTRIYEPGQDIVIPEYVVHWLANPNTRKLEFTCECAPHPWRGQEDEPEFENFEKLLRFAEERGFYRELSKRDLSEVLG